MLRGWRVGEGQGAGEAGLPLPVCNVLSCPSEGPALTRAGYQLGEGWGDRWGSDLQPGGLHQEPGDHSAAASLWQERSSPFEPGMSHRTIHRGFSRLWEEPDYICLCWGEPPWPAALLQPVCSHRSIQRAKAY